MRLAPRSALPRIASSTSPLMEPSAAAGTMSIAPCAQDLRAQRRFHLGGPKQAADLHGRVDELVRLGRRDGRGGVVGDDRKLGFAGAGYGGDRLAVGEQRLPPGAGPVADLHQETGVLLPGGADRDPGGEAPMGDDLIGVVARLLDRLAKLPRVILGFDDDVRFAGEADQEVRLAASQADARVVGLDLVFLEEIAAAPQVRGVPPPALSVLPDEIASAALRSDPARRHSLDPCAATSRNLAAFAWNSTKGPAQEGGAPQDVGLAGFQQAKDREGSWWSRGESNP